MRREEGGRKTDSEWVARDLLQEGEGSVAERGRGGQGGEGEGGDRPKERGRGGRDGGEGERGGRGR